MAFGSSFKLVMPCAALRNSMLAMWQAARNTDYYITKYVTKALEQLQNLIGQFARGLRRLELEEQQERDAGDAAVIANQQDYKRRARRINLALAMAANRATWASCCEIALFIARHTSPEISTSAGYHTCPKHDCVC